MPPQASIEEVAASTQCAEAERTRQPEPESHPPFMTIKGFIRRLRLRLRNRGIVARLLEFPEPVVIIIGHRIPSLCLPVFGNCVLRAFEKFPCLL